MKLVDYRLKIYQTCEKQRGYWFNSARLLLSKIFCSIIQKDGVTDKDEDFEVNEEDVALETKSDLPSISNIEKILPFLLPHCSRQQRMKEQKGVGPEVVIH